MGIKYSFVELFPSFLYGGGGFKALKYHCVGLYKKYMYDKYISIIKLIISTINLRNRKLINFA